MEGKYSPLDHAGLESIDGHDGLEPVERTDGLEVVRMSSPPLDSISDGRQAAWQNQMEQEYGYYLGGEAGSDSTQTPHSDLGKPAYCSSEDEERSHVMRQSKSGRRYCGMRKWMFIAVVATVVLLICIAAVLGGVLGVWLPKEMSE